MPMPRFADVLVVALLLAASPAGAAGIAAPRPLGEASPEIDGPASSGRCAASPISPTAATPPLGLSGCSGVRPGAAVRTDAGLCTLGFLFRGTDGERYVATSAQCMGAFFGQRAPARGRGVVASDEFGSRIGEFAYGVTDIRADFALIRLDRDVPASGHMCHFGGPTDRNDDGGSKPVVLHYYGTGFLTARISVVPEGVGLGRVAPGRSAFAVGLDDPDWVFAFGTGTYGDLGSPVISSDGRAVGLLVFAGVVLSGIHSGTLGIMRLGPQVDRAEARLKIGLDLVTAPVTSGAVP
jgi:hypothetical protein